MPVSELDDQSGEGYQAGNIVQMVDAQAVQTSDLSDAYEVNTEGWDID